MTVPPLAPEWCTYVNATCTVEGTLYGYRPNLGANVFFAVIFGLCGLIQLGLGIRYRTWTFMIALTLGCLGEVIGYAGRLIMNNNPYDENGFTTQICCLIISPAFIAAGVYLTLKHLVLTFGEEWSRLRAPLYTYIFISCDIVSLVLQGAGGGIASTADEGSSAQDAGTNLMIAGVIFQVVVLVFFAGFVIDYFIRTRNRRSQLSASAIQLSHSTRFRVFLGAIVLAYLGILIRCAYRIPELTEGWGSELMRNEVDFIVLEGAMVVISVLALTICHPGYCFPALANTIGSKKRRNGEKSMESSDEGSGVAV